MAVSRNRKAHKVKKKIKNVKKQQLREMANEIKNSPITFVYHKDRKTVEIPLAEWQTLNQSAERLRDIAMFVVTMEQIGRQHLEDGTLLPVFSGDTKLSGRKHPDGSLITDSQGNPELMITDEFYAKHSPTSVTPKMEKPTIVKADGKTIFDESKKVTEPKVEAPAPTL